MSNNGWIKLHRQITDNVLWLDAEPFDRRSAWIDLLLMVNHEERQIMVNGQIRTVERGQTLTSEVKLADRWHWSRDRVRRYLSAIETAKMVSVNRTSYGTWINVENYTFFQGQATGNKTGVNTAIDTADKTANKTAVDTQTRNKEYKNIKNDKNFLCGADAQKKIPPSKDEVEAYCRENGFRFDIDEFMAYYNLNGWTLSGGRKITDWTAAVDYWAKKGTKIDKASDDLTKTMPMYQEFSHSSMQVGVDQPFEGGLVQEMLKRKRTKKNAG